MSDYRGMAKEKMTYIHNGICFSYGSVRWLSRRETTASKTKGLNPVPRVHSLPSWPPQVWHGACYPQPIHAHNIKQECFEKSEVSCAGKRTELETMLHKLSQSEENEYHIFFSFVAGGFYTDTESVMCIWHKNRNEVVQENVKTDRSGEGQEEGGRGWGRSGWTLTK